MNMQELKSKFSFMEIFKVNTYLKFPFTSNTSTISNIHMLYILYIQKLSISLSFYRKKQQQQQQKHLAMDFAFVCPILKG